jgi:hypothetical protein
MRSQILYILQSTVLHYLYTDDQECAKLFFML